MTLKGYEDPDVEILLGKDHVTVLVDLRGNGERVKIKAVKDKLYLFDEEKKEVIKIIDLPTRVKPESLKFRVSLGTYIINLKREL